MENIYTFDDALIRVITKLNAPKGQRNSFGNYNYRSAEDIVEAVKPLLFEEGLRMKITDVVEQIGERYYVKATVVVKGFGESDESSAYAREPESKKGMDEAQITGATSSYARKYALNGMFDIDDTKDADTDEHRNQQSSPQATKEVRNRAEEIKQGPAPMGETTDETLARAKKAINEQMIKQGYDRSDSKQTFIKQVLQKTTIDNLNDADAVADALDNEL